MIFLLYIYKEKKKVSESKNYTDLYTIGEEELERQI